ncbi:MAG: O-antigen ligase family protein, partial [Anaerolineales bacterium]|nr:O-antigen ligase family protein [Anaerolineales bacterium]
RWKWGWIGVAAGVLISAGVVWRVGIAQVLDILLVGATISGADGRVQIWQRALYMIQDFPFTGVGMGLYGDVAEALYPFPGVDPRFMPHAHQLFLQVAVDMGLPGGMAWLAIFVQSILVAWRVYKMARQEKNAWMTGLAAGLLASQVALTLHGLIDAVTWGMVRPAPLVWGLWGLIFAAHLDLSGRVEKPILPPNEYSPSVGSSEKKG